MYLVNDVDEIVVLGDIAFDTCKSLLMKNKKGMFAYGGYNVF